MKGYKIFIKRSDKWSGPYYECPKNWVIRAGSILEESYVDTSHLPCGRGVNFWTNKQSALNNYKCWVNNLGRKRVAVYEVETLAPCYGPRCIKNGVDNKKRTTKLKLVRRLKNSRKELS